MQDTLDVKSGSGKCDRTTQRATLKGYPSPLAGRAGVRALLDESAYLRDAWERGVLFLDTLRERADNLLEHERAGLPPLLDFEYETLVDGRGLARPVNYALLRITEAEGACAADCARPDKPPVMVVDPRAGHGPGIGGFKRDSEVGMALRAGHAVYFVIFYPQPVPGQTLGDVHHALRHFVEIVAARHGGEAPVLYGNCQAGWAVTLLAADCEGLAGAAVLNGSPLSYWAGESGINPMRVAGGLLGGAWLAHFVSDLADGRFDGAWLAQNFEGLKPEQAVWRKHADLFTRIDTERDRFLEFERWWNGFYFLGREEIVAIVENLFVGNRLERGELRICPGCVVDLRRIRNPIVIFSSYGDNITPPHQALGWIPAVYEDTHALERAGQRIVYLTHPHVGHLGIFVSASVARSAHRAILGSLERVRGLEPGLYEMKIVDTETPEGVGPEVRFERRCVEDIRFARGGEAFERARTVSEALAWSYRTFASPWVRAAANPWSAEAQKWLHPMRLRSYSLSATFAPWMRGVELLARAVRRGRVPLPEDHAMLRRERAALDAIGDVIENARKLRDAWYEAWFDMAYLNPAAAWIDAAWQSVAQTANAAQPSCCAEDGAKARRER